MERSTGEPLGYLLYRASALLLAEVSATVLEPSELATAEYFCMRMLWRSLGKSNAELAREARVSPQAMNKVVRELEERGLVTRPATVSSGRSLPARLTADGVALIERLDPRVAEAEDRVLAGLTAPERREFRRLLATVG